MPHDSPYLNPPDHPAEQPRHEDVECPECETYNVTYEGDKKYLCETCGYEWEVE